MTARRRWLEQEMQSVHPPVWGPLWVKGQRPGAPAPEYVVVDEIEEGVAVLVIEPWPKLDQRGRLSFAGGESRQDVEVEVSEFEALLRDRVPIDELTDAQRAAFVDRPLRVGDVFCAAIDRGSLEADPNQPARWIGGPVVDVSPEARDAAKAQYFAAVGPVLEPGEVEDIAADFFSDLDSG